MNRKLFRAGLALALLVSAALHARADKIDDYVNEQIRVRNIPGVEVGIVRGGKLELARGYGLASVELKVPVAPDTVFEIGSMTKQFTSALVMMLVEEGKIGLDDKIAKYLADSPAAWKEITVRHLLTHTSGIKGYTEVAPDFLSLARNPHTQQEIVKMVADKPLDFQPGEKWAYSNTGYYLLGMILEKVSGKSYMELLSERILKPLGMTATRDGDPAAVIPGRACGYLWSGKLVNAPALQPTAAFAAGCLVSTVGDLAKWDAALAGDKLLKASSRAAIWTPVKLNSGSTHDYGFGWAFSRPGGRKVIEHGGGTAGFSTVICRYVDEKITIIVLTNRQDGNATGLARGIAAFEPALAQIAEKPVDDPDPALTKKLHAVVLTMAAGAADTTLFTPEFRAEIFPDKAKEAAQILASLGALKSFSLASRAADTAVTTLRYRGQFDKATLIFQFTIAKDGKIAGLGVMPE
jgi:D-alanyl-D-alanine carboxypeptidase